MPAESTLVLREKYARALEAAHEVADFLGIEVAEPGDDGYDEASVEATVDLVVTAIRERLDADAQGSDPDAVAGARFARLAFRLSESRQELVTETIERHWSGLTNVQLALGRLRAIRSSAEMMARAPKILSEQCGFHMAALSRVGESGRILPVSGFHAADAEWGDKYVQALTDEVKVYLDASLLETEMLRRRTAVVVHDAYNDPRTGPVNSVLRASGTRSYVAAPIMPEGRVIGFLHATNHDVPVDLVDRDILWAFAEGYGYALERTILVERLYRHGERIRELLRDTDGVLEEMREADLQMAGITTGIETTGRVPRSTAFSGPRSSIHDLLTRREIEIIELMAHGDTNRQIADRLIVSEGTAKAHVSQILRKLKAANRAEAVSYYTRMLHD
jgi:DNA-binding CsgD family transcriptional regulator/GAF domain-containing protein